MRGGRRCVHICWIVTSSHPTYSQYLHIFGLQAYWLSHGFVPSTFVPAFHWSSGLYYLVFFRSRLRTCHERGSSCWQSWCCATNLCYHSWWVCVGIWRITHSEGRLPSIRASFILPWHPLWFYHFWFPLWKPIYGCFYFQSFTRHTRCQPVITSWRGHIFFWKFVPFVIRHFWKHRGWTSLFLTNPSTWLIKSWGWQWTLWILYSLLSWSTYFFIWSQCWFTQC